MNFNTLILTVSEFSEWWWNTVLFMTWQSSLICLLLLAVVWCGRRWSSPLRYGILLVALGKFAVPPLMTLPIDHLEWKAESRIHSMREFHGESLRFQVESDWIAKENPIAPDSSLSNSTVERDPAVFNGMGTIENSPTYPISTSIPVFRFEFDWFLFFFITHLLGFMIVSFWIFWQWRRLVSITRKSSRMGENEQDVCVKQLRSGLNLRRNIAFRVSSEVDFPIAFGILKPVILLPHGFPERLSRKEQEAILAHELAHHARRDTLVNGLQLLLTAVWWFNPFVWVLNHEIRRIREDCCDDLLLSRGITSNDEYCETLLRAAAGQARPLFLAVSTALAEPMHPLGTRIRRIMDHTLLRTPKLTHFGLAIIVVLSFMLLPVFLKKSGQRLWLYDRADKYEIVPTDYAFKSVSMPLQGAPGETILGYGTLQAMDCSSDGRILVTAGGLGLFVWDLNVSRTEPVRWCPIEDERIISFAMSPDGKRIAVGGETGNLTIWDTNQWEKMYTKNVHAEWPINETVFSPDGKYVLTGGGEGIMKLWDSKTGDFVISYRVREKGISDITFSFDGTKILAVYERSNKVYLWDTKTGTLIRTFYGDGSLVTAAAFSPDGKKVLAAASETAGTLQDSISITLTLIGVEEKQTVDDFFEEHTGFLGHKREIYDLAFSPDGGTLVTGSNDGTAKVWDVKTGQEKFSVGEEYRRVIDEPRRYDNSRTIFFTKFIEEGKRIVLGDHNGTIRFWDVEQRRETNRMDIHVAQLAKFAMLDDGSEFVLGGFDGSIKLQNLQTGEIIRTFGEHNDYISDVEFSPNGKTIASLGRTGEIKVWEKESGKLLHEFKGKDEWFGSITFSPDGNYLVAGDTMVTDRQYLKIKWFELETGTVSQTWKRYFQLDSQFASMPRDQIRHAVDTIFVGDGKQVLIPVSSKTEVWDVQAAKAIEEVTIGDGYGWPKAVSPDGLKAALSGVSLEIWDIREGKLMHTLLDRQMGGMNYISVIAYSLDGRYLLSADQKGLMRLWDMETIQEIRMIYKPTYFVEFLRFSSDDSKVYIGTRDGMRIWDRSALFDS
ncbi:MAG: hypothetical protein C4527_08760 [Candidatus Omnitrophota bacterium]|jgi:WD40 repeat protein|nr:MAG: hypothetical protein C4527_08760 [Candidatus Omnitrophota bacterium]